MIEEKVALSGLTKKDLIARSCINSKICVVDSKENIRYVLDVIREMKYSLVMIGEKLSGGKLIAGEDKAGELPLSNDSFAEMSLRYAILCSIIVDILDGSAYLFDKEAPERVRASERLAHIEELIASVEKVSKKKDGVNVLIVTSGKGNLTDKDIAKFNSQYPKLTVKISKDFHDRFLIIDRKEVYHIGASIKDAGKKSFGITKLEVEELTKSLLAKVL